MGPSNPTPQFPLTFSENYGEPVEVKRRVTRFEKGHSGRWELGKEVVHVCGGQRTEGERRVIVYVGWRQYFTPKVVHFQQSTRRYILEDKTLLKYRCGNFESHLGQRPVLKFPFYDPFILVFPI
jgi:hypothetical protein